jgi:hypothetical protein
MAPKRTETNDEMTEVSKTIYALAQADAANKLIAMREEIEALKQESFGMGALHAIEANITYNEFLKAMTLYRIKKEKEYRTGGMTWVDFCEARGMSRPTVDRMLDDLKPIVDSFSLNLSSFCGMPFSKIRLLGKQISLNLSEIENNNLIYGDESIPLTPEHRDDIQALIERISDDAKEKIEDLEATVSAKEKVLKSKGDVITKMERALKKYEKEAAVMGITPEEDAYIQQINGLKMGFDGYLLRLEKNIVPEDYDTFTPRMKAALISAAHYMQMQILALYETITTEHGNPTMNPELLAGFDAWEKEHQQG